MSEQTATELSGSTATTHQTLLLVDDSVAFRERLARAFRDRGFNVCTAGNYDEAMARADEIVPSMAVVDLRMPGPSGLNLVREQAVSITQHRFGALQQRIL